MTAFRPRRLLAEASRSARRIALQRLLGLAGASSAYAAGSVAAAERAAPERPDPRLGVTSFGAVPGTLERPARDSTAAIQRAIDTVSASGGGEVFLPAGVFWVTGIMMAPRVTLVGTGWASVLKLLPGSNQHVVRASTNRRSSDGGCTDEMYAIMSLAVDGNRDAQSADWWGDGIHLDMTFDNEAIPAAPNNLWRVNDHHHVLQRLFIRDCKRDGIFIAGKGGHTGSHLHIGRCTRFGMHLRSYDNLWSQINIGGVGADGVRVAAGPNHFTCSKTFFTGQATQKLTDGSVAGEGVDAEDWRFGAGWSFMDGGVACVLSSCEVQDTWGHGVVLAGSEVMLNGMRFGNIGSLARRFGKGRQPPLPDVGAVWFGPKAADNVVEGVVGDQFVKYRRESPNTLESVTVVAGAARNRVRLKVVPGHVLDRPVSAAAREAARGDPNDILID
jgi:hypothetical protein